MPLKPAFVVIRKFSYVWPELEDLWNQIPNQCNVKYDCKIELLRNHHIFLRFNLVEEFVNMMLKSSTKYDYSYPIIPLIYDPKYKVEEEITQVMAGLPFPDLKPTFL